MDLWNYLIMAIISLDYGNGDDGEEIDCDDGNYKSMFFMRR